MKTLMPLGLVLALILAGCTGGVASTPVQDSGAGSSAANTVGPADSPESAALAESDTPMDAGVDGTTDIPAGERPVVGTVVYQSVTYMQDGGEGSHPYAHSVTTNNTNKTLVNNQFGMLAFDKDGQPLQIRWVSTDSSIGAAYHFLCDWGAYYEALTPGETEDVPGGWSLNVLGDDEEAGRIAYILYCDKQLTFDDGTVWDNPGYEDWLARYEGQPITVEELESYYPYIEVIETENA